MNCGKEKRIMANYVLTVLHVMCSMVANVMHCDCDGVEHAPNRWYRTEI